MSAEAFAYVLVLRGGKLKNELTDLLSQERRTEVQAVLDKAKEMSQTEVREQLKQLRNSQINAQRENAGKRIGLDLSRVSPELRAWLTRPF